MGNISRQELNNELNNELDKIKNIEENYSTKEELQDMNDTLMSHLAQTVKKFISITDPPFNAVGDFDEELNTGTDNRNMIQRCFDESPKYANILIPEGVFAISDFIVPREGQTITFLGKLVLSNPNKEIGVMMRLSHPNITLNNPRLDMRKDYNLISTNNGTQTVLDNYGNGHNATINGGIIENGVQNGLSGGRNNLTINGTQFNNMGEHGLYLNGLVGTDGSSENLILNNVKVDGVALNTNGEGIKIRNYKNIQITNPIIECRTPLEASRLFMMTNVQNVKITGGVGNGYTHYGFLIDNLSSNVIVDGFISTRGGNQGSNAYSNCTGENIKFINCISYGSTIGGNTGDDFINCEFYEIPAELSPTKKMKFLNCKFSFQESAQRILKVSGGVPIIDNCDFYGNPSIGIWYAEGSTTNQERLVVKNSRFHDFTGGNGILIAFGKDHQIVNNEFPLSTSSYVVKISSSDGKSLLADNYIPNGNINISERVVTIQRDNILSD